MDIIDAWITTKVRSAYNSVIQTQNRQSIGIHLLLIVSATLIPSHPIARAEDLIE
jgi:hypothetical protein